MAEYEKPKGYKIRSTDWNYGGGKWKLSRSKIDLFMECERCFYLDNRLGIARPRGPAFTLNIAVDKLLKKEFDVHRALGTPHPLMKRYKLDAIPLDHKDIDSWRENFVGVQYHYAPEGFLITGAVDDIWVNKDGEFIVVDYKATSKDGDVTELSDTKWQTQYKRQMDIYQWLLRQKGYKVSSTGYFLYVNGKTDKESFDGKLEFDINLIAYKGDDGWIPETLHKIKKCLDREVIPSAGVDCEFCAYRESAGRAFRRIIETKISERDGKKVISHTHDEKKSNKKEKTESHQTESLF